jgi:ABC-type branched-subunit amino acid transport system substrate-binding protein
MSGRRQSRAFGALVALAAAAGCLSRGSGSGAGAGAGRVGESSGGDRALVPDGASTEPGVAGQAVEKDGPPVDRALVAVLLPESGAHTALGREMRAAIELAAEGASARGAKLRFLDTRGDPGEAVRQVEVAFASGALAVLGPVGHRESQAAAARAAELRLPIAVLAPGLAMDPAAGILRLVMAPEDEAALAAEFAIERGHGRLAVLAPKDDPGAAQAQAFARAARAGGAEVVATGFYDPQARDLQPDIKAFLGLDPAKNQRLRRHLRARGARAGWKTFSPDVPFDLLYLPDQHRRAALVASFLPYFNVELRTSELIDARSLRRKHGGRIPSLVQLLGSSGWHHQGLLSRGGPAVEGALVVVPCPVGVDSEDLAFEPSEASIEFAARFRSRTGRAAGPVAAEAFDAATLALAARAGAAARARTGRSARAGFVTALATARLGDGACGPATLHPPGVLRRPGGLVQVDAGAFVAVDWEAPLPSR